MSSTLANHLRAVDDVVNTAAGAALAALAPPAGPTDTELLALVAISLFELHRPDTEEAEVWADGPGAHTHDEMYPDCPGVLHDERCAGHTATIQVCQECGYEHDGETPIYRLWPCPTVELAIAAAQATGVPLP